MATKSSKSASVFAPKSGKVVAPATVSVSLLATYGASIDSYRDLQVLTIAQTFEIELGFIRQAVDSGLSQNDIKATLKAGQEKAKADGYKVLPNLGVGKVQVWSKALYLYDTVEEVQALDLPALLNLAWNAQRLPEGFKLADKSLGEIEDAIPPRKETAPKAGKTDKPAIATSRAKTPTLTQLAEIVDTVMEGLPEDLTTLTEFDLTAIVRIGRKFAGLNRSLKVKISA